MVKEGLLGATVGALVVATEGVAVPGVGVGVGVSGLDMFSYLKRTP